MEASFRQRIETFPDSFFVAEDENGRIIGFINGCVTDLLAGPERRPDDFPRSCGIDLSAAMAGLACHRHLLDHVPHRNALRRAERSLDAGGSAHGPHYIKQDGQIYPPSS